MMLRLWRGFGMRAALIVIPMSITPIVVARPNAGVAVARSSSRAPNVGA
jgi:hypothetical protein